MKVRLSKRASGQIEAALAYVALQSPQGAMRIGHRLRQIWRLLEENPKLGKVTDEQGARRLSLSPFPYLIDYSVQGDELIVLRFRHGARRE